MGSSPQEGPPARGPAQITSYEMQSPAGASSSALSGQSRASSSSRTQDGRDHDGPEDTDDGSNPEMNRRHSMVQDLARQYTRRSEMERPGSSQHLFQTEDANSPLNPHSTKFSARAWARAVAELARHEGAGFRKAGICFENMNVFGYGNETDYQKDVGNVWLGLPGLVRRFTSPTGGQRRIDILRSFDGLVEPGEMLVVLGPPGAGCSTFLKAIAGETNGIHVDKGTYLNYQGISATEMHTHHRGDAIYTAEVDVHFPRLTVGDTLTFASRARCPQHLPPGVTRDQYCDHLRDVIMAMYGISHTVNTQVGNEYVRGVSGGERKRVTIAEASLSHAPLQCWDNSTRGLDSANAIEFCRTLRTQSLMFDQTSAVSIYQAPQAAYDQFDKTLVIYEGRQIYFGPARQAKDYFVQLGFECPDRQTTPDFLTSMTAASERLVRPGWEHKVPRTPDDFAAYWKNSQAFADLRASIRAYREAHPLDGPDAAAFRAQKQAVQAKGQSPRSPFLRSYAQQVSLCLWRGWKRLLGDPGITVFSLLSNTVMGLVFSSLFYNLQETTSSFYQRSVVLFVAVLVNALASALEILNQYAQRPIVEKHVRYAFNHASAEALASIIVDMPYKILNSIFYNLTLYFMTHLRREPGSFFYFLLVSFLMVLAMSGIFRSM